MHFYINIFKVLDLVKTNYLRKIHPLVEIDIVTYCII